MRVEFQFFPPNVRGADSSLRGRTVSSCSGSERRFAGGNCTDGQGFATSERDWLKKRIFDSGGSSRICRAASMPFSFRSPMSSRIRSGLLPNVASAAWWPVQRRGSSCHSAFLQNAILVRSLPMNVKVGVGYDRLHSGEKFCASCLR